MRPVRSVRQLVEPPLEARPLVVRDAADFWLAANDPRYQRGHKKRGY